MLSEFIILTFFAGLLAGMIDSSLSMAYGVSGTSFLLAVGLGPAIASAMIHQAEVFTTLASGVSHLKFGNVNTALFKKLVIPGSIAAVVGAYALVNIPFSAARPAIALYLLFMGIIIILTAFGKRLLLWRRIHPAFLAAFGGFFDAVGGGGWGPIVTTNLIANGEDPRKTIGSVCLAEFFVTLSSGATFVALLGLHNLELVLALILGGIVIAPLGALMAKRAPTKILMIIVGAVIIGLQLRILILG